VKTFGAYLPSWAKTGLFDQVPGDGTAIKVIVGEKDPAVPAEMIEETWLAFFPGAEVEAVSSVGHCAMSGIAVALATSLREFLGRR
jgi:esterase